MSHRPTAVILVIAHKSEIDDRERRSLQQCFRVLGRHPIRLICPRGLDVSCYRAVVPQVEVDFIPPKWQATYENFNRLKVHPFLYRRYRAYDFVLFYELDAWAFRDELDEWCREGYDYIGAPWLHSDTPLWSPDVRVGNGGFSLRRVEAMLRVTHSFRWFESPLSIAYRKYFKRSQWVRGFASLIVNALARNNTFYLLNRWSTGEDLYWGLEVPRLFPWFRIAPAEVAARFAFEEYPRRLFDKLGGRLPFGCHAWARYDPDFWRPYVEGPEFSAP